MKYKLNKTINITFFSLLFIFLINWFGWPYQVRFDYIPLNYWVYSFLCFSLPLSALFASFSLKESGLKISGILGSILIGIPIFIVGLFALSYAQGTTKSGEDASLVYLKQVESKLGVYRLYRTNCGATCTYGLDLKREIDLPIGIKLVKTVWSQSNVDSADLIATDTSIRIMHNNVIKAEVN